VSQITSAVELMQLENDTNQVWFFGVYPAVLLSFCIRSVSRVNTEQDCVLSIAQGKQPADKVHVLFSSAAERFLIGAEGMPVVARRHLAIDQRD
jgi:hypothetical protein